MNKRTSLSSMALIAASALALAACGGGGGGDQPGSAGGGSNGGNTGGTPVQPPVSAVPAGTTLSSPSYTADSVASAVLQTVNGYRKQCGFPVANQNTILDKAATSHADYMASNGSLVTDFQEQGKTGFTGVRARDRAIAQGWPAELGAGTVNAGLFSTGTLTPTEFGQNFAASWAAGAYHQIIVASHQTLFGIGATSTTLKEFKGVVGGVVFSSPTPTPANITSDGNVLTWPCEGVTGMSYKVVSELPKPPGVGTAFGTPVTALGNPGDVVTITSANMVSSTGTVINLLVLNAANDPAKIVQQYQAVAYPANPLEPNTSYSVTLNGTINGKAFTRSFRFTTGDGVA